MQSDLPSRAAESRSLHEVPYPEDAILRKMSYLSPAILHGFLSFILSPTRNS